MANDQKLKKGYAAPLEGISVSTLLSLAFAGIGFKALADLSNKPKLKRSNTPEATASKPDAPSITSGFIAPRPPTMI